MRRFCILLTALLGLTQMAFAADYQYVSAEELRGWLETAKPVLLIDIQEAQDFAAHHIKGSVETNGYPVKSDEDRARLQSALKMGLAGKYDSVVVVCPRGKGGAKRTYDFLAQKGVPVAKLFILTGGMAKWPYPEWVTAK